MEKIKEANKNIIALKNNYFAILIIVSSGVAGLILAKEHNFVSITLLLFGLYLIVVFILKIQDASNAIENNIKRCKDDFRL